MSLPAESDGPDFDRAAAVAIIRRVLALPGGPELVTSSLAQIPGALVVQARSGLFGTKESSVQLGPWRYSAGAAGRVTVAHVIGNVVLSEDQLSPPAAAQHITAAIGQHITDFGTHVLPEVLSVLEGLAVASW
jgi:hypothetical protein